MKTEMIAWAVAALAVAAYARAKGKLGAAVAVTAARPVSVEDVIEAVPAHAGALALDMWKRSHAHDLGYMVPVGSGILDRAEILKRAA